MRALDISLSLAALVLLCPVLLGAALLVKISSPGSILYRGRRVGVGGESFELFKFRTMRADEGNGGSRVTRRADPRVTRIGRLLRRSKIDELPQLFNVLRGDMSLVGPRPEDPEYVRYYNAEQRRLLQIRPGITSPASIAFRHEEENLAGPDVEELYLQTILPRKLAIDLNYFSERSLSGDLGVLWRTLCAVFRWPDKSKEVSHNTK